MYLKNSLLIGLFLWILSVEYNLNAQPKTVNNFPGKLKTANKLLNREFFNHAGSSLNPNNKEQASGSDRQSVLMTLSDIQKREVAFSACLNRLVRSADTVSLGDTLVIGVEPGEELVIDSDWVHNGPILIIGDGILHFEGAHATIIGDIFTAENGQLIADSSFLYFPQEYFYQRMLLVTGNSGMHYHNTTIDFGGMVHTMATVGTSVLEFDHVSKADFTTFGLYNSSSIIIDSIDKAGEFVVGDSVNLNIQDAATVLLWHGFPVGSSADISFPDGAFVNNYEFNDQVSGVQGVGYDISLNNCTGVMWGMMPSASSDVTVSNSDIRSIGFWFENSDSLEVNGLVNNSHYGDFTAPLTDRNFHLINCDVMTWSLYSYDNAYVDVSGSIVGEIGAMEQSEVQALNYYCDGSGGYVWVTDTAFLVSGFSSVSASVRTSRNGMMIFAYSNQMNGLVQALDQSILMLIQSNITAIPTYDPGAVIWMANITGPGTAYQNTVVPVEGSAWIDKGNESNLMDFAYYLMYYQKEGETSWHMIGDTNYTEVRKQVLTQWDTHGIEPGAYFVKMILWDDMGNNLEAFTQMMLLPDILGIPDPKTEVQNYVVSPNPASSKLQITFILVRQSEVSLTLYDSYGKKVMTRQQGVLEAGEHREELSVEPLPGGIYYLMLQTGGKKTIRKIIVL